MNFKSKPVTRERRVKTTETLRVIPDSRSGIQTFLTLAIFAIGFFAFSSQAQADYYAQGILESKNMLSGATVTAINGFQIVATIPAGTTVSVKFSQDKVNYYNSAGVKEGWDTAVNGTTNVNLSGLAWTGGILFYKLQLTSTDVALTPTVSDAQVDYDGTAVPALSGNSYPTQGAIVSTDFLAGGVMTFDSTVHFAYNVTSLPSSTSMSVQFSQDGVSWYSSNGTLWGEDVLPIGSHLDMASSLALSTLNWTGATSFYYKINLYSPLDDNLTPAIGDAGLIKPDQVYYSVGQSTADLKTGTLPTVTIASGVATFSAAQTGNIGVGDRVTYGQIDITTFADQGGGTTRLTTSAAHGFSQYDYITISGTTNYNGTYQINNVSDATNLDITKTYVAEAGGAAKFVGNIAYISSKTSTSVWNLINPRGGVPTDRAAAQTVVSIKHEYTSLSAAVTGAVDANHLNTTDLVTGNYQLNFPCYYDSAADTTAVTVTGYTTGASNFIKIYTPNNTTNEANFSQRHNGKWDDDRYALSGGSLNTLTIQQSYTKIMGLQVTSSSTAWTTIVFGPDYDYVEFDSCISKNTGTGYAIQLYGTDGSSVKNSIFYGSSASRVVALRFGGSVQNVFYNNTVYGSGGSENGIYTEGYSPLIKNCIVQNTGGSAYASSFDSASNYNISDDSSNTGGAQDQIETIVSFADAANKDFHLSPNDTAAKNAGADLSADANLPITTDIDGQGRDAINGRLYDIGADQAATAIYYSVGQNTTSHETGAGTVTVDATARTATFSVAQTATNMGVGDLITYAGGACYITNKTSTTVWGCQTATGTAPTAVTNADVTSIAHAYASLSAVEAGAVDATHLNTTDLVSGNYQLNFPCYYDTGADTTAVTVSGYTTGVSNYIKIYTPNNIATEVNQSQRHSGKWDDGKYNLIMSGSIFSAILLQEDFTFIDGLQIKEQPSSGYNANGIIGSKYPDPIYGIAIANNIVWYAGSGNSDGNGISVGSGSTGVNNPGVRIYNNIVYGWTIGVSSHGITTNSSDGIIYNNTTYGNTNGVGASWTNSSRLINNLSYNNSGYNIYCGQNSTSDYNLSGPTKTDACGVHSKNAVTVAFADAANKDFHLSPSDTAARNFGVDLSSDSFYSFANDIDNQTRNTTINAWDIGADEAATAVYYSVGQNTNSHETGSGTVTVDATARTATFSVAQTATNMGVGDLITYAGGSCYISSKTSTSVWGCQSAIGAAPTAVTDADVTSIAHAYASLSAAEAGAVDATHLNTADLVAGNYQLNFPCYYDSGADTTVVTVDGYTTGPANYIKIYTPNNTTTEVNVSQRHQGKATGVNYLINPSTNGNAIALNIPYVKLVGLEITDFGNPGFASSALYFPGIKYITIDSNYIHDEFPSNNGTGISANGSTAGGAYISNNIINNVNNGMNLDSWSGVNSYAYNNTLRLIASVGFRHSTIGQAVLKNNITQNCGDGFLGTFNVTSDYNISDLAADAPGANSKNSTTVAFADAANKDFHLSPTDTAARNFGVDLSSDSSYLFTTDIDNQTRPSSSSTIWDIGADEAAAPIYYSVGQSVADLKIGTPTITITSGVATFSAAQTGNIGVGDRVTYNTTDIAYIASKTSTSVWTLVTKTGAVPADITTSTVVSIKHEYTSLSAAVTGAVDANHLNTTDLVTGNYQLNFPCYYDSAADTTAVTVSGYTTGVSNFIKIYTPFNTATEANNSQRHSGKWDDGKYRIEVGNSMLSVLGFSINYIRVEGLQFKKTVSSYSDPAGVTMSGAENGEIIFSNNIIKFSDTSIYWHRGLSYHKSSSPGTQVVKIFNNLIYDIKNSLGEGTGIYIVQYGIHYIFNNTVLNSNICYKHENAAAIVTLKNNIAQGCVDGFLTLASFNAASDYNISDLVADAPGANSKNSTTVAFADAPNKDFHLSISDTSARNSGSDLSADLNLPITTDIDGQTRPTGAGIVDIGADEAATAIYYSVGQNTTDHKTGTPTVTIASGTATFSVAQTATNMGVGDKIVYNVSSIMYISEKVSETQWKVITATGATPADVTGQTVNSIAHEYSSLEGAVDTGNGIGVFDSAHLNTTDLVTGNYQLNIPCYYDSGTDNTYTNVRQYKTSFSNYIKIYTPNNTSTEVNLSQRHSGKWDNTKYAITAAIYPYGAENIIIDGIQSVINQVSPTDYFSNIVGFSTDYLEVRNSIFVHTGLVTTDYRQNAIWAKSNAKISNNIIYGGHYQGIYFQFENGGTSYVYNNTISGTISKGVYKNGGSAPVVLKNNIANGNATDYSGTFDAASANNISQDATSPNAAFRNKTVSFVDAANKDFHLSSSDTAARKAGLNLQNDSYLHFGEDIDGQGRAGDWDIGADEFAEVVQQSQLSSPNLDAGLVGHWTFDGKDISGTTAKDTSGNNNNGIISGATKAIGKLGQGTDFSAATNVVTVPDKDNLDGMSQLTLSAWINPRTSGIGTSFGRIIEKGNGSSYNFLFVGNNLECDIGVTAVGSTTSPLSGKYNSWHHVDCVYDGANVSIYLDGVSVASAAKTGVVGSGSTAMTIGNNVAGDRTFNGKIDDVRVYNRALSVNEIEQLYHFGQVEVRETGTTTIRK